MLKTVLKWFGIVLGVIVLIVAGFALFIQLRGIPSYPTRKIDLKVEVTPARVDAGRKIVNELCANCHFDQATNRLTGKKMADLTGKFGVAYSRNITQDPVFGIGAWTDGDIAFLLRTGIKKDGRYAPPWMVKLPHMADEDLYSVIAFLRSSDTLVQAAQVKDHESEPSWFAKFLCFVAFKPFPYPDKPIGKPQITEKVAYGKYLVTGVLGCFQCHSADFATNNDLDPEKSAGYMGGGNTLNDATGRIVFSPNITMDKETGIGGWTEAQFIQTLRMGIKPDHTPLRYPMERMPDISDEEMSAIWAYLQTVPRLRVVNKMTGDIETAANASQGEQIYNKYSCYSCHGTTGVGTCDLRQASNKYKTNDELTAWIRDPSKTVPGSKMPTWNGTIQESEYAPLCDYVRLLGEKALVAQAQ